MNAFEPILSILNEIDDPRRVEGRLYDLPHITLFTILAIVTGVNSYRGVRTFIKKLLINLNETFDINWRRDPAHTTIRNIIQQLNPTSVEAAFRKDAENLRNRVVTAGTQQVALDGKVLRNSFDVFKDVKARQVLSAFDAGAEIILAHFEVDDKSNEIPAAQRLIEELNLKGCITTLDAMHPTFRTPALHNAVR